MAENVNIVGFPASVLKDALNEVPPWATEKTAKQLEILLSRSIKVQEQSAKKLIEAVKDGITKGTDISLEPLHDYLDELEKANEQLKKNRKNEEDAEAERKKREKAEQDRMTYAADTIIAGMTKISLSIRSSLSSSIKAFRDLDNAGVGVSSGFGDVSSGFRSLGHISKNTGVRISELSGILKQYSTAINVAGMAKFTKIVGESSKVLNDFGYTNKEAAELLGAYLETERSRGEDATRSQFSMRKQVEMFGKTVRELGKTSGLAREEILANLKAQSASTDSFVNAIKLGADAGKNIDLFVASLKDQDLARKISEMMTTEFKTINKTYMDLVKTGNGALASSFSQVLESAKGLDPAAQKKMLMDWAAANESALDQAAVQSQRMKDAGVEGAVESLATIRSLKTELKSYRSMSDEERAADEKAAEASAELASEYEKLKAQLTTLITPIASLVKGLTFAISIVNTAISSVAGVINSLNENTTSVILHVVGVLTGLAAAGLALSKAIFLVNGAMALFRAGLIKSIANRIMGIPLVPGTGGVAGAGGIAGTAGTAGGIAGGALDSSSPGKASGIGRTLKSVGSGVGSIVASLGAGAGKLIESVMSGIAKGVSAFGNPVVLKGALIFSAALAIISAGVRLSAFVLGDSLPKIAEGFKSFSDIDGMNLMQVGVGIGAIAAGLLAFTASSIVSNVGSVIGSLTEGFMGLVGISGPMDRLKSFAAMGPMLEAAGRGLASITNSINSLSGAITSIPDSGRLRDLIKDINSLSLVKAASLGALLAMGTGSSMAQPSAPGSTVASVPAAVKQPLRSVIRAQEQVIKDKVGVEKSTQPEVVKQTVSIAQRAETVDINSMINQQNITLLRLLDNAESQLSINREMLQYIRNQ